MVIIIATLLVVGSLALGHVITAHMDRSLSPAVPDRCDMSRRPRLAGDQRPAYLMRAKTANRTTANLKIIDLKALDTKDIR